MWTKKQPDTWSKKLLHRSACPIPSDCPQQLAQLIKGCTTFSPTKRPSFDKIRKYLRKLGISENVENGVLCSECFSIFDTKQNTKHNCKHIGTWHDNFADCGVLCAKGLGPKHIGKPHWGCCYSTNAAIKPCRKSTYHVAQMRPR